MTLQLPCGGVIPDAGVCAGGAAPGGIDRLPGSRLAFRAPLLFLGHGHAGQRTRLVALGGAETFGACVDRPWPALLAQILGFEVCNLGAINAGAEALARDPVLPDACRGAAAVILQIGGAHQVSNPFYRVHPWRNDRIVAPEPALCALYPELDFAEFAFSRHLLRRLRDVGPRRFATVCEVLQAAWLRRMQAITARIPAPVVLLWMSDRPPDAVPEGLPLRDPLFVTRAMVDHLGAPAITTVECVAATHAAFEGARLGEGDDCARAAAGQLRRAAQALPSQAEHHAAAHSLARVLAPRLGGHTGPDTTAAQAGALP